jgi:hypothetical protein
LSNADRITFRSAVLSTGFLWEVTRTKTCGISAGARPCKERWFRNVRVPCSRHDAGWVFGWFQYPTLPLRVTAKRTRSAVGTLAAFQLDRGGNRVWSEARALLDSEHQRVAVGQVAVPFGMCSEPSSVTAGGGSCPFRFRCLGCGHFRTDPSYLPELRGYLDSLLQSRERIRSAADLDDWARAEAMPSDEEITRLRQLIRRAEHDLSQLGEADRRQVAQAVGAVRATRRAVHPGMPAFRPPLHEGLA